MNQSEIAARMDLKGKVVVITGASGQLGRELSESFEAMGAKVRGVDWSKESVPGILRADISKKDEVAAAFESVVREEGRIDVLINNAGIACFEPFESRPEESFDRVMDVNLKGTFFCIQAYARLAEARGFKGSIVNVGSIYGAVSPDPRIYTDCARQSSEVYGATKAGVVQMTRYFAVHLARLGIRVNCVSPGGIRSLTVGQGDDFVENYSRRVPFGRMADVREMVGAVLYFASELSSYTTGQNLLVDGGLSAW